MPPEVVTLVLTLVVQWLIGSLFTAVFVRGGHKLAEKSNLAFGKAFSVAALSYGVGMLIGAVFSAVTGVSTITWWVLAISVVTAFGTLWFFVHRIVGLPSGRAMRVALMTLGVHLAVLAVCFVIVFAMAKLL